MALTDALERGAASLKALSEQMAQISGQVMRVEIQAASAGADRDDAEAIKRGQKPETIAAMKRALGL